MIDTTPVAAGDPLDIGAGTWNGVTEAAARVLSDGGRGGVATGGRRASRLVLVENKTGGDLPRFGCVGIHRAALTNAPGLWAGQVGDVPPMEARLYDAMKPLGVVQEPIPDGGLGLCAVSGWAVAAVETGSGSIGDTVGFVDGTANTSTDMSAVGRYGLRFVVDKAGADSGGSGRTLCLIDLDKRPAVYATLTKASLQNPEAEEVAADGQVVDNPRIWGGQLGGYPSISVGGAGMPYAFLEGEIGRVEELRPGAWLMTAIFPPRTGDVRPAMVLQVLPGNNLGFDYIRMGP